MIWINRVKVKVNGTAPSCVARELVLPIFGTATLRN
jgi:hypothetical protein